MLFIVVLVLLVGLLTRLAPSAVLLFTSRPEVEVGSFSGSSLVSVCPCLANSSSVSSSPPAAVDDPSAVDLRVDSATSTSIPSPVTTIARMSVLRGLHSWTGLELLATTAVDALDTATATASGAAAGSVSLLALPVLFTLPLCPGSSKPLDPCWDSAQLLQWQLRSAAAVKLLEARDSALVQWFTADELTEVRSTLPACDLRSVFVLVMTGVVNHRTRAHSVMATWGTRFLASQLRFVTDVDDQPTSTELWDGVSERPRGRYDSNSSSGESGTCIVKLIGSTATLPLLPVSRSRCPMNYDESQSKWLLGWAAAFKLSELDGRHSWYLTVDDDSYVSSANLIELLRGINPEEPWVIGSLCYEGAAHERLCGGAGWLFSVGAARLVRPLLEECQWYKDPHLPAYKEQKWSDLFIGGCWKDKLGDKLKWRHTDTFQQFKADDAVDRGASRIGRSVTYHDSKTWKSALSLFVRERAYEPSTTRAALEQLREQLVLLARRPDADLTADSGNETTVQPSVPVIPSHLLPASCSLYFDEQELEDTSMLSEEERLAAGVRSVCHSPRLPLDVRSLSSQLPVALHPASFASQLSSSAAPLTAAQFRVRLLSYGYQRDPLPACSVHSPLLTLNLLAFVRYIQTPLLNSRCEGGSRECKNVLYQQQAELMRQKAIELSSGNGANESFSILQPRWVQYQCQADCGGWADRLKGILSTVLYGLLTGRAISLDVSLPVRLSEALSPSVLPWLEQPSNSTDAELVLGEAAGWHDFFFVDQPWSVPLGPDTSAPGVRIRTNMNSFVLLMENYPHRATQLGFNVASDMDAYTGCLYSLLFTPTPAMRSSIRSVTAPLRQHREQLLAQAAIRQLTCPAAASSSLLCAQLRFGTVNATAELQLSFQDSEQFFRPDYLPAVFARLNQTAHELSMSCEANNTGNSSTERVLRSSSLLLVLSDSPVVHLLAEQYFNASSSSSASLVQVLPMLEGPIVHVDKVASHLNHSERSAGLVRALAEHYLLGLCTRAIVSNGGFGSTAMWRTAWTRQQSNSAARYQHVQRAMPDGSIVPMVHVRGTGGRQ